MLKINELVKKLGLAEREDELEDEAPFSGLKEISIILSKGKKDDRKKPKGDIKQMLLIGLKKGKNGDVSK